MHVTNTLHRLAAHGIAYSPSRSCVSVRRKLESIGETGVLPKNLQREADRLLPGTILTRIYDDVEHHVLVRGVRDFEYLGQRFTSLTAVAKVITGCPWSGPLFFGLKTRSKQEAS